MFVTFGVVKGTQIAVVSRGFGLVAIASSIGIAAAGITIRAFTTMWGSLAGDTPVTGRQVRCRQLIALVVASGVPIM